MMMQPPAEAARSVEALDGERETRLNRWSVKAERLGDCAVLDRMECDNQVDAEAAYARLQTQYPHALVVLRGTGELRVGGELREVSVHAFRPGHALPEAVAPDGEMPDVPVHLTANLGDACEVYCDKCGDRRIRVREGVPPHPRTDRANKASRILSTTPLLRAVEDEALVAFRDGIGMPSLLDRIGQCRTEGGFGYLLWAHQSAEGEIVLQITEGRDLPAGGGANAWESPRCHGLLLLPDGAVPDADPQTAEGIAAQEVEDCQAYLNGRCFELVLERCLAPVGPHGAVYDTVRHRRCARRDQVPDLAAGMGGFDPARPDERGWMHFRLD